MSTTITIKPDSTTGEDLYIDQNDPDTNKSGVNDIYIIQPDPNTAQMLIRFDLGSIPKDATILSAKLGLYADLVDGDPVVKVYQAITGWVFSTVTWNTAPYPGTRGKNLTLVENAYTEVDVTDFIQEWVNKEKENYGFHIVGNLCASVGHEISSSRNIAPAERPYLTITYTSGPGGIQGGKIIKMSGDVLLTTSFANIDTTNLKYNLPEAGTYILNATLRFHHDGDTNSYAKLKLYDNTAGADVPNSTRIIVEYQSAAQGYTTLAVHYTWMITVNEPSTIYIQGYCSAANTCGQNADANGGCECSWVKIF